MDIFVGLVWSGYLGVKMNNEKFIQKIKKLLNLAKKSTNPNEAASAMSKAQALMQKHGVTESDSRLSGICESSTKGAPSDALQPPKYVALLGEVIAIAFGVKWYATYRYTTQRGVPKRVLVFYGPDERPEIAAYAFDVLSLQLKKGRNDYLSTLRKNIKTTTKTARADTWCESWVQGAYQTIQEFAISESEETLMASYLQRMKEKGGIKSGSTREAKSCRGKDEAAIRGYIAGKQASLNHGVKGSAQSDIKGIGSNQS